MKAKNHIVLALSLCCLLFSYESYSQSKKSTQKSSKTTTVLAEETSLKEESESGSTTNQSESLGLLNNHSKEIQTIIQNEKGVIRGLDFGATLAKIKSTETGEFVSEGHDFIIYKILANDKESAEIIYYLDESMKIKGFGIAFMVNAGLVANDVEATLIDDFQNYFSDRYGKFTTNNKNDDVWTSKDGSYTVEMGDSSEGLELTEIEIEIFRK